jgi:protein TonB
MKSSINKNRFAFFNIGLIISCLFVLWAFQWKTVEKPYLIVDDTTEMDVMSIVTIWTEPEQEKEREKEKSVKREEPFKDDLIIEISDIKIPSLTLKIDLKKIDLGNNKRALPVIETGNAIEIMPDIKPSFPGGNEALKKFMRNNLRYPDRARINEISGTVTLSFLVDEFGNISNIEILKNELGYDGEQEALRMMKLMPKWEPGYYKGNKIKARFIQNIRFELR